MAHLQAIILYKVSCDTKGLTDLIYNKGPLLSKHLSHDLWKGTTVKTPPHKFVYVQSIYIYIYIYTQLFIITIYTKLFLRFFNSGSFFTNHVMNDFKEVFPYYKSSHTYMTHFDTLLISKFRNWYSKWIIHLEGRGWCYD